MKRKLLVSIAALMFLAACSPNTQEVSANFRLPSELRDCKLYSMSDGYRRITVIRCPNSATATSYYDASSKTTKQSIVID